MTPDLDLTNRVAGGDAEAVAQLYERFGSLVYYVASGIVRDRGHADDVVQTTFLQVLQQAGRVNASRGSVTGWLLAIARTRAIDHTRAVCRRSRWLTQLDDSDSIIDQSGLLSPEQAFLASEVTMRLQHAVKLLPVPQRIAIELAFYRGFTHAEIAAALRTPVGTVKTRIRLAIERLRRSLVTGDLSTPPCEPFLFTVTLAEYLSTDRPAPGISTLLQGVRVLIVGDDCETVELVRAVLESSGATVASAQSAAEALDRLQAAWSHVMLADLRMPVEDGYALLRNVLVEARGRRLRAAAFTARNDSPQKILAAGFDMHLRKPVQPAQVVDAVAALARAA